MVDILKREKQFQKLNEELDKKTKSIIEKSSNITPTTTIKSNLNQVTKSKDFKNETKEEAKKYFQKANTIPKRFRDSLTNRKTKETKTALEVSEKSVQISEDEFANEAEDKEAEKNNDNSPENSSDIHVEPEPLIKETEPIISKYSTFKEEMKQVLLPKANTVPKRLRDTLTNRKIKEKKNSDHKEKSVKDAEISTNECKDTNEEDNEKIQENEILSENEDNKIEASMTSSTSNTFTKIKYSTNSLNSVKSSDTDTSSIKSSKKSSVTADSFPIKKNLTAEGLVKYLKSKVSILEVELTNTKTELNKQIKQLEQSYETQQKFEAQRDQAISKNNTLTEQIEKTNEKLNDLEKKLKDREAEVNNVKRELENLKREIKVLNQNNKNLEKRLYRANEELENSKSSVDSIKKNERNQQENARVEKEKLEKQIKDLKRQRNEFLNAYKKQLFLIDNLKRQNVCLEQCHIIGFGEKQFSKVLDLNKEIN